MTAKTSHRLLDRVCQFGQVDLSISDVKLADVSIDTGSDAIYGFKITSFTFHADISWPAAYKGLPR